MRAVAAGFAGEDIGMHQRVGMDRGCEIILQPAREMEGRLGRHILDTLK